jgi:hypothetical protein
MALAQYSELFWFPSGELATEVPARVFVHDSNTLATLWADEAGTVPLANPASTSGAGRLEFWAEEGLYWVHIDSEAFEVAVGTGVQPVTHAALDEAIDAEVTRADATYATLTVVNTLTGTVTTLSGQVSNLDGFVQNALTRVAAIEQGTAFLAALNVAGDAQVAGGNLTVTDFTKGYRFRVDGSALDLEATGTDLIVSNWSGDGFNGTQRSYARLSADALNTQWAGKFEFVDALYGTVRHTLDGANNTAGFFGATPINLPTVDGSWADGTAGESLAAALALLGLITDNTTP